MGDTSLVFNIIGRDRGANAMIARTGANVRAVNAMSAASTVALGAAMVSAGANALALAAGVGQVVGLLGLVPGAALAAAAGLGVLRLATLNIGAALKTTAGGAGRSVSGLADAEHRVEVAQRRVLETQNALNDARAQAAHDLAALTRQLNGARLDEESAILAVANAEADLRRARRRGGATGIQEADLAYRQSLQTLEDAKARTADLSAEQADAAARGVDNAKTVQNAAQQQADAVYELARAQRALAEARSGGGGGGADPAAEAFAKLAPAAKELVTTIRALTPAWQAFQRGIQQQVFTGVAGDVRTLSAIWLPRLENRLGAVAGAWNFAIRAAAGFFSTPAVVADIDASLAAVVSTSQRLAQAVRPILAGITNIGVVGAQFLPGLAGDVATLATRFERWTAAARQSGQLATWFANAVTVMKQLVAIAWNVSAAIMAVFRAGGADEGQVMLAWLVDMTGRMADFLNSAQGQAKISDALAKLRDILATVVALMPALVGEGGALSDTFAVTGTVMGFLADHLGLLRDLLPILAAGFLLAKTAQIGANVAVAVSIPLRIAEFAATVGTRGAIKANTAALLQHTAAQRVSTVATGVNTTATNVSAATKVRETAALVAGRIATIAGTVATKAAAVATFLFGMAMRALPIFAIITLIMLLVAGIIYLWNHNETFRKIVLAVWGAIKAAIHAVADWIMNTAVPAIVKAFHWIIDKIMDVHHWIVDKMTAVVKFIFGLRDKIASAARGMWDGLVSTFKGVINFLISLWNRLDFGINIRVPDWVPFVGGKGFSVPDLFPDIPYLAKGGDITSGGMAVVGERGPETVLLPTGARVSPLSNGDGQRVIIEIRSGGSRMDELLVERLREAIRVRGGNVVTVLSP